MNELEAKTILEGELSRYRRYPFADLLSLLNEIQTFERAAPSGVHYQIEIHVFWDERSKKTLRVTGAIDDGARRAWRPLCSDFIMRPDGVFVDE